MKINRDLLPIKAHYFLRYAGMAPMLVMLPVVVREKGMSAGEVGMLWTILQIVGLVTNTLFGTLADRFRAHRTVFIGSIVCLAVGCYSVFLLPKIPEEGHLRSDHNLSISESEHIRSDHNFSSKIPEEVHLRSDHNFSISISESDHIRPDANLSSTSSKPTSYTPSLTQLTDPEMTVGEGQLPLGESAPTDVPLLELIRYPQFWLIISGLLLQQMGNSTCFMITDAVCFQILDGARHKYGEQRLWGAIGMGIFVIVGGALTDLFSAGRDTPNYLPLTLVSLVFLSLDLLVVARMRIPNKLDHKLKIVDVGSVLVHPRVLLFLVTVYVFGLVLGIIWLFKLMLVEDVSLAWDPHFPALKLLQGLDVGIETFGGELPCFFLSGMVIQKFGHTSVLALSLMSLGLQCCLYYTVVNPWLFLPIELLQGINYSLAHTAMTSFTSHIAPPGAPATLQSIVKAVLYAGISTAGLLGGWLYQKVGGSTLFLVVGVGVFSYSVIFTGLHLVITLVCGLGRTPGYHSLGSSSPSTPPPSSPPPDTDSSTLEDLEFEPMTYGTWGYCRGGGAGQVRSGEGIEGQAFTTVPRIYIPNRVEGGEGVLE